MTLHTGFLFLAGTRTAILRAGLVELPYQVEKEGATRRIKHRQLAWTIQGGLGLVAVEYVVATQVEGKQAHAAQVEVALNTHIDMPLSLQEAAVAHIALWIETSTGIDAPALGQLDSIIPAQVQVRAIECDGRIVGRRRLVVLEEQINKPCGVPF